MLNRHIGLLTVCILAAVLLAPQAAASRFGRDGFSGNPDTNGGATCNACHAAGARRPSVTLDGPSTVSAGSTARFQVVVQGGPAVTGGVNVSSSGVADSTELGTFAAVNGDLAPVGGEISHARPKPFGGDRVVFEFDWTAPAYGGPVTLYAAGNSSDGELDLLGDGIATATANVTVEGGGSPPPPPPPPPAPAVQAVPLVSGLERPVAVRHAGDGRLFVVEQRGRIRIIEPDGTLRSPAFLFIEDRVEDAGNEQGLLGLAFHPEFQDNGYFYVYYTHDAGSGNVRSRISRFRVSDSYPNRSWQTSERVLLEFEQPFANHNAGDLHFGPDGYLYIASGDGGSAGDPHDMAQNPNTLLGKILRIDVDGGGGSSDCNLLDGERYGVPPGNAYAGGGGGCAEIYALGVRNPWRMSFDRETGDLWIADVGQSSAEEVNRIAQGTSSGLNLGWRCYEGDQVYNDAGCSGSYFEALFVARHGDGYCSITGGYVYRGAQVPDLRGRYFFSDFCNTAIATLVRSNGEVRLQQVLPAGEITQPVAFGEDVHGELLVVSLDGTVYRLQGQGSSGIGEAGNVSVSQAGSGQWHRVTFERSYSDPVVVMGPPTRNGGDPLTVRVRDVSGSGFEFQLDEWDYRDGSHVTEQLGYLVVERGTHRLADGRRLTAGRTSRNHQWGWLGFEPPFKMRPVVLTQTASHRGGQAVSERLRNIYRTGFQSRLQEEEGNDGAHATEVQHWIAVEPGASAAVEAGRLPDVSDAGAVLGLAHGHSSNPVVLGASATSRGGDTIALRIVRADGSSVEVALEEEQSTDTETAHVGEDVGYLVLSPGSVR